MAMRMISLGRAIEEGRSSNDPVARADYETAIRLHSDIFAEINEDFRRERNQGLESLVNKAVAAGKRLAQRLIEPPRM